MMVLGTHMLLIRCHGALAAIGIAHWVRFRTRAGVAVAVAIRRGTNARAAVAGHMACSKPL
jgi:hypothetical protein